MYGVHKGNTDARHTTVCVSQDLQKTIAIGLIPVFVVLSILLPGLLIQPFCTHP